MICYKDMTFCGFHSICKDGYNCNIALTEQVKKDAEEWMKNAPIAVYEDYPECFNPFILGE